MAHILTRSLAALHQGSKTMRFQPYQIRKGLDGKLPCLPFTSRALENQCAPCNKINLLLRRQTTAKARSTPSCFSCFHTQVTQSWGRHWTVPQLSATHSRLPGRAAMIASGPKKLPCLRRPAAQQKTKVRHKRIKLNMLYAVW